ncbi:MAG: SurA N-terminal domain-containing protein [Deltaproteobacteria bacterium]|jgi:peptidyl-prolyl cis-trans isomerase D|nr:SurA N-terminal domain-containing protein [Deltaproteobacteria bacterium]
MLDYIRKRTSGAFSIIIIGAIALVFIFWGIGGQDSGSPDDIKIDGQAISPALYYEMEENILEQLRAQNRQLTPEDQLSARQQALSNLITRVNVLTLARATGRRPSAEAVNLAVKSDERFKVDGRFSKRLYEETAPRLYGRPLAALEALIAEDQMINDAVSMIMGLAYAPSATVLEDFHFAQDQVAAKYVFFPAKAFSEGLSPDEAALTAFYEAEKEKWRRPAEVRLEYVEVKFADYADQVEASAEDLEDAYAEEKESLTAPEQVEVSHIMLRFPSLEPSEEEKLAVRLAAEAALLRAQGEDFVALAQELSQDSTTAAKGGSLGFIERGQSLPTIEEAVFGAIPPLPGQLVGPVETVFGYHLLKVGERRPARTKSFEEAKEELTALVVRRKARRLAVNRIEDLLEALPTTTSASNLKDTARSLGLEVAETEFFDGPDNAPPFFDGDPDKIKEATATPLSQTGRPVEGPESLIVYVPLERRDSFIPPLDDPEIRQAAVAAWIEARASELAAQAAEDFLKAAADQGWDAAETDLSAAAEQGRAETGQTPLLGRFRFFEAGPPVAAGEPLQLLEALLRLNRPGDVAPRPVPVESSEAPGFVVLSATAFEAADESTLTAADVESRQRFARGNLGRNAFNFWAGGRSAAVKLTLPPAIEAQLTQ